MAAKNSKLQYRKKQQTKNAAYRKSLSQEKKQDIAFDRKNKKSLSKIIQTVKECRVVIKPLASSIVQKYMNLYNFRHSLNIM